MRELAQDVLAGEEAWVVGGAVRDELLGREVIDLDVACREPERAARAYRADARAARRSRSPSGTAPGGSRSRAAAPSTSRRCPGAIEDDLATRDFTINAIAEPLAGGEPVDPFGGAATSARSVIRAVSPSVFEDDPLRLMRAVRLEDELGFRLEPETEALVREHAGLVTRPAGERTLAELVRLSADGYRRADELGLLAPLEGSSAGPTGHRSTARRFASSRVFGEAAAALPGLERDCSATPAPLLRATRPEDGSPRSIHRFRRETEPWALDALVFVGAPELEEEVQAAREHEPSEPLLRGDELGLPPGPEIGRLLELIAEERAAGTISTREQALELVRRSSG